MHNAKKISACHETLSWFTRRSIRSPMFLHLFGKVTRTGNKSVIKTIITEKVRFSVMILHLTSLSCDAVARNGDRGQRVISFIIFFYWGSSRRNSHYTNVLHCLWLHELIQPRRNQQKFLSSAQVVVHKGGKMQRADRNMQNQIALCPLFAGGRIRIICVCADRFVKFAFCGFVHVTLVYN